MMKNYNKSSETRSGYLDMLPSELRLRTQPVTRSSSHVFSFFYARKKPQTKPCDELMLQITTNKSRRSVKYESWLPVSPTKPT